MRPCNGMRLSGLAATLLLGLSGTALAADPATIYSDFANTGRLACTYDRGSLQRVLDDASLYQYSDARTIARLRLAVRGQLAGSCQRAASSSQSSSSAAPTAGTPGSGGPGAGPDAQTAATGSGSGLPGSDGASSATGGGSASTPPGASGPTAGGEPGRRPSGLGAQGQPAGPGSPVPGVLSSSEGPGESVWSPLWIGLVVVAAAGIGAAGFVARRTLMQ